MCRSLLAFAFALGLAATACTPSGGSTVAPPSTNHRGRPGRPVPQPIDHLEWSDAMSGLGVGLEFEGTAMLLYDTPEGRVMRELASGRIRWRREGVLGVDVPARPDPDVAAWFTDPRDERFVGRLQLTDGALAWERPWRGVGGGSGVHQPVAGRNGRGLALWGECMIIPLDPAGGHPLCGTLHGRWMTFDEGPPVCMDEPVLLGQFGRESLVLGMHADAGTTGVFSCAAGEVSPLRAELPGVHPWSVRWVEPGLVLATTDDGPVALRIDERTGEIRWTQRPHSSGSDAPRSSSVRVARVGDEGLILMQAGDVGHAFEVNDGAPRWQTEVGDAWALVEGERSFEASGRGQLRHRAHARAIQWLSPDGTPTTRHALDSGQVPYLDPEGVVLVSPEGVRMVDPQGVTRWRLAEAPIHAIYRAGPWLVMHGGEPGGLYHHSIVDATTGRVQQCVPDTEWFLGADGHHVALARRDPGRVFVVKVPGP